MKANIHDIKKLLNTTKICLTEVGQTLFFEAVKEFENDEKKQEEALALADKLGVLLNGKDYYTAVIAATTVFASVYSAFDLKQIISTLEKCDKRDEQKTEVMFG